MKNSLLLGIILIAVSAQAQWRNLSLQVSGNVPVINSVIDHSIMTIPIVTESGYGVVSIDIAARQSFSRKIGFDIGSRFEYSVSKRFFLASGLSVTHMRFRRTMEMITTSGFEPPTQNDVPELGNTSLWNLQVPLLAGFSFAGEKLKVKAGPAFAFLLQATEVKQQYNLATASYSPYKDHSKGGFGKVQTAGVVEVTFQATKRIGIDANARYFVTSLYANGEKAYTPYTTLGLGISYTF